MRPPNRPGARSPRQLHRLSVNVEHRDWGRREHACDLHRLIPDVQDLVRDVAREQHAGVRPEAMHLPFQMHFAVAGFAQHYLFRIVEVNRRGRTGR